VALPDWLRDVLPPGTGAAWLAIRDVLPRSAYLGGGTAIATHLRHRVSRDLDFFLREPVDLAALADALEARGPLAISQFEQRAGEQTLNALFHETKVQFLDASSLVVLEPTSEVAGIPVASLGDLMAMKLKVVLDRGELRDYFDLLAIERDGGRYVEEGVAMALRKYRPRAPAAFVESVLRGLGYLDDVLDDPAVPIPRAEVAAYWERRVPQVTAALSRLA
jgi:Nucleotidyl transferase AbiEii toxin, Type IV TA system